MSIVVLPQQQRRTGLQDFTEGMSPYLQMAFKAMLERQLAAPGQEMDQSKLKLLQNKAEQDTLTGVSKGELPATSIPKQYLNPASINTQGLTGTPETMAGLRNVDLTSGDYEVRGTPDFMKRVMPETPQAAQSRMMSSYATQQQNINPYKALLAARNSVLLPIYEKVKLGQPITEDEKIFISLKSKEKDLDPAEQLMMTFLAKSLGVNVPTSDQQPSSSKTDEFGFSIGEVKKGHKYIGNNKWQKQ